jgi:hypothetical protein
MMMPTHGLFTNPDIENVPLLTLVYVAIVAHLNISLPIALPTVVIVVDKMDILLSTALNKYPREPLVAPAMAMTICTETALKIFVIPVEQLDILPLTVLLEPLRNRTESANVDVILMILKPVECIILVQGVPITAVTARNQIDQKTYKFLTISLSVKDVFLTTIMNSLQMTLNVYIIIVMEKDEEPLSNVKFVKKPDLPLKCIIWKA